VRKLLETSRKIAITILSPASVGFLFYIIAFHFEEFFSELSKFGFFIILLPLSFVFGGILWLDVYKEKFGYILTLFIYLLFCIISYYLFYDFKI